LPDPLLESSSLIISGASLFHPLLESSSLSLESESLANVSQSVRLNLQLLLVCVCVLAVCPDCVLSSDPYSYLHR
jgi:hypothetical protein